MIIIYFSYRQFKFTKKVLNIDVNFRVFEFRSKTINQLRKYVQLIKENNSFLHPNLGFVMGKEINYERSPYRDTIDNSKYVFSPKVAENIELFLYKIEHGMQMEIKVEHLKEKLAEKHNKIDNQRLQELEQKWSKIFDEVINFDLNEFYEFLNVSNFDKDLTKMSPK